MQLTRKAKDQSDEEPLQLTCEDDAVVRNSHDAGRNVDGRDMVVQYAKYGRDMETM